MSRFSAGNNAIIDDKGRFVLPAAYKKAMGDLAEQPLVVEKDIYKPCLNIYPEQNYNEKLKEMESKLNHFNETDDALLDEIYENFTTLTMAPNGRINIPSDFMEYAGLTGDDRELRFVGRGNFIRMWNERIYREVKEARPDLLRDHFRKRLGNNPQDV